MGKGDKRTRRGKIFSKSFGNCRKKTQKIAKTPSSKKPESTKK